MRTARKTSLLGLLLLLGAGPAESPVADAAMRKDIAGVRALLQKGADVNAPQGDGMTALHWAARHGDAQLTTLLLRSRANPRVITRIGAHTPLHIASQFAHGSIVSALLGAGSDANALTTTGVSSLHLAAQAGSGAAITALLDRGAKIDVMEPAWGQTPLMLAAAHGRLDAVKLLIARGADHKLAAKVVDLVTLAAEDRQARQKRNEALAGFRTAQGNAATWQPKPDQVQAAVRAGLAVEKKADAAVNAPPEETPPATGGGDDDAPGFTAAVGFQGGLTALLLAVREGHTDVMLALLDAGADINQAITADQTTPILLAAINGHYDLTRLLLERGANPKLASNAGATPLYAVINKEWAPSSRTPQPTFHQQQKTTYLELMEALLKAGADVNARLTRSLWYTTYNRDNLRVDFRGATPFWRAAYGTDVKAMKLLLAYGADPNIATIKPAGRGRGGTDARRDPSGLPPVPDNGPGVWPIHAASGVGYGQGYAANDHRHVQDGWMHAVKFLVEELGADVNARDHAGYTPLHNAAARGDNEMIRYLVSKGADPKAVARSGQTTVDMANGPVQRISPYVDTVKLLESLGARNNNRCVSC